jgi:hypothetical protein
MNNAGEYIVEINGVPTKVKDMKMPAARATFGYGHFPEDIALRPVCPGEWPYTPDTCPTDDYRFDNLWTPDGTTLMCRGCGLDVT